MWVNNSAAVLNRVVTPLSKSGLILGGICSVIMMLLIVTEAVLRSFFPLAIPGDIEMVELLLLIAMFSGMAHAGINEVHIRVDILVDTFAPTVKLGLTVCTDFLAFFAVSFLAWQTVEQAMFLTDSITGMLRIPLWPFALVAALLLAIFALSLLVAFLNSFSAILAKGTKHYLWLIPCFLSVFVLFIMPLQPDIFPLEMEFTTLGIVGFLILFLLIFLRLHIGAAMAIVAFWGMCYGAAPSAGLALLGMTTKTVASNYNWSVAPMFILMGLIISVAGFAKDIYDVAYKWLGHLRGGLASATVCACGAMAAMVGDSMTGLLTMTNIALPQMRKYKYDIKMALGSLCAGSTVGILIPPSIGFIIYGMLTETSIGKLFIAGILPGILQVVSFIALIVIRCRFNPELGPMGPKTTIQEKIVSLKGGWVVIVLFLLVIGRIWAGYFTPTPAGAVGAFGAIVIGLVMRKLNFDKLSRALGESLQMLALVFFIFIYAVAFSQFLGLTRLPFVLAEYVAGLELSKYVVLSIILLGYLFIGCIMNAVPAIILTLPVLFPVVSRLGFDPIWFGVLIVFIVEIGVLTPPIGMNVFAMSGLVKDVPIFTIYKGVFPFWIVMLVNIIIITIFPQIALFLPNLMMGG